MNVRIFLLNNKLDNTERYPIQVYPIDTRRQNYQRPQSQPRETRSQSQSRKRSRSPYNKEENRFTKRPRESFRDDEPFRSARDERPRDSFNERPRDSFRDEPFKSARDETRPRDSFNERPRASSKDEVREQFADQRQDESKLEKWEKALKSKESILKDQQRMQDKKFDELRTMEEDLNTKFKIIEKIQSMENYLKQFQATCESYMKMTIKK